MCCTVASVSTARRERRTCARLMMNWGSPCLEVILILWWWMSTKHTNLPITLTLNWLPLLSLLLSRVQSPPIGITPLLCHPVLITAEGHAVKRANIQQGDTVVVLGPGLFGTWLFTICTNYFIILRHCGAIMCGMGSTKKAGKSSCDWDRPI